MSVNFSPEQSAVIDLNCGYNMVLAGPGCGKTEILAERIARAVEQNRVDLREVLCLTFTNRAARGMQRRIQQRLNHETNGLFVGNIHRYCSRFLFDNELVAENACIIDEEDASEIADEIADEDVQKLIHYYQDKEDYYHLISVDWHLVNNLLNINIRPSGDTGKIKGEKAKKIIKQVKIRVVQAAQLIFQIRAGHPTEDMLQADLLKSLVRYGGFSSIDNFREAILKHEGPFTTNFSANKFLLLAEQMLQYKQDNHYLDFDDLLIYTYDAYFHDEHKVFKRYPWVQVDEIQDLSHMQLSLIDLFTNTENDFVVLYLGDEQQAIYSFMGASLDSLNYLKNRCIGHIYHLYKNFRSPKYLLDLYNDYATKELALDKDFVPEPKDYVVQARQDICLHLYESESQEVERVKDVLLPYLTKNTEETTAILVPWNKDANEISNRLTLDKIPHFKISGTDTFQTVPMKTLLAHFSVAFNEFSSIAWSKILKQTYALDTFKQGRQFVKSMQDVAMTPRDLLLEKGGQTYLSRFCDMFDNQEIVLFDTETTGLDIFTDDIIQIAAVKISRGKIVFGSEFNIFLDTKKNFPKYLGETPNPMRAVYQKTEKKPRAEGLSAFVKYVGNCALMGHNVNFDYHILQQNLRRDCPNEPIHLSEQFLDTLKVSQLLFPRLKRHKLEYLLKTFKLQGMNSHLADDDILATYEVAKFFRQKSDPFLEKQQRFLQEKLTLQVKNEWEEDGYKACYLHTLSQLYAKSSRELALIGEMKYVHEHLQRICEIPSVERFDVVLNFISAQIIENEPNILACHLYNHLTDIGTYREGDLCDCACFKEKLFVSTVHKAKGLEFDNVIVMYSVTTRYPSFAHITPREQEEDKRLFYVALSRAKKRLIVSASLSPNAITPYVNSVIDYFCIRFVLNNGKLAEIFKQNFYLKHENLVIPLKQALYDGRICALIPYNVREFIDKKLMD